MAVKAGAVTSILHRPELRPAPSFFLVSSPSPLWALRLSENVVAALCSSYPLATHTEKCAFVHLHLFSPPASIVLTHPRTPCLFSSQWHRPCKISFPSFPCLLRLPTMAPCTKAALLRYQGSCPAERKWGALLSILQSQKKKRRWAKSLKFTSWKIQHTTESKYDWCPQSKLFIRQTHFANFDINC